MTKVLQLADKLALPLDVATKKNAFLGMNGSGKSYAATKLAELLLAAGGQIVAVDPVGIWYGLRLDKNGKSKGFEIPVFGGLYGDIPLQPSAGAMIADVIADRGISAVLDVSQFEFDTDRTRFMTAFAERIFFRKKAKPSALHIFLEECQEFLPQNPQRGEEKMLHQWIRIGKVGRNYGFGWTLISPRPQDINKKALNLSELVMAFQTNGTHERKAISEWVKEKGQDVDIVAVLPKLKPGFAHAWSPSWLEISETVHVLEKKTFNASATPKFGAAAVEQRPLASIDLEKLKKDMAATIEKAKATDPVELKKQIAERDSRIRQLEKQKPASATKTVEVRVVDQAAIQRAVSAAVTADRKRILLPVAQLRRAVTSLLTADLPGRVGAIAGRVGAISGLLQESSVPASGEASGRLENTSLKIDVGARAGMDRSVGAQVRTAPEPRRSPAGDVGGISGAKRKIINTIALLNALGIGRPSIIQVALFNGVSHTTGSYLQNIRELVNEGLVEREKGEVGLYPETPFDEPGLSLSVVEFWYNKLPGAQSKLLKLIADAHPEQLAIEELAERAGVSHTTGSFLQNIREMATLGIIERGKGWVQASQLLLLDGR